MESGVVDLHSISTNLNKVAANLRDLQKSVETATETMQELSQALTSAIALEEELGNDS
jgi:uncharacterized protein YoxC